MTGLQSIIDLIHKLDERLDAGQEQNHNWRETDQLLSNIKSDLKRQLSRERLLTGSVTEFSHAYSQLVNEISMLGNVSHLLESSPTPTDLFDRLPKLLRREFRADSVSIMLLEKESQTLEIVGASVVDKLPEGNGVSIPIGEGVAGWVARYRRPWLAADTTSDRQFKVYPEARVQPRALLSVPIVRHDQILGVINLGSESTGSFTERHEELLGVVTNMLAVSLSSANLYEELESHISYQNQELIEVRDFLENVINNSDDVIVVFDTYQKILLVSPSVNEMFGYEVKELVGSHITALLTDGSAFSRLVKMMDQEDVLRDLDMVIPHRDGNEIPTAMTVSRMTHSQGHTIGYLAMIRNIERRAHLYRELSRANERLRALFAASQKITSTLKINEVLGSIVQSTLTLLDADSAMLLLFNQQSGELEPIVRAGQESLETATADSPLGIVARQGKALLLEDRRTVRQFFPEIDPRVKSKIVIPLTAQDSILGVLDIDSLREERVFTADDRNLANSFALQASLAVENARLYGTTHIERHRFQELLALARQANTGMKLEEVIPLYATHVTQQTEVLACHIYQRLEDGFKLLAKQENETDLKLADFVISQEQLTECLPQGKPLTAEESVSGQRCFSTCFPIGQPEQADQFGVLVVFSKAVSLEPGDAGFLQVLILQLLSRVKDLRLNAEVTQTKNYLENLIASSIDAIVSTDRKGNITLFSRGAQEMFGYSSDDMLNQSVTQLLTDPDELWRYMRRYVRSKDHLPSKELKFIRSDGVAFWVSLSVSWLHNEHDEIIGALGIAKDMTAKHKLEAESLRAMQLATLTQTAVTLNDRINNPLGVILNNAELMLELGEDLPKTQKKTLNTIIKQVREIQGIVNKLKEVTKPIIKDYALEGKTMIDLEKSGSEENEKEPEPQQKQSGQKSINRDKSGKQRSTKKKS
jgi:PAS domain S-box-containing protein